MRPGRAPIRGTAARPAPVPIKNRGLNSAGTPGLIDAAASIAAPMTPAEFTEFHEQRGFRIPRTRWRVPGAGISHA